VDWVLLAAGSLLRDGVVASVGGGPGLAMNPDLEPDPALSLERATRGMAAIEAARAALAEDVNLNVRLVVERAFLSLAADAA